MNYPKTSYRMPSLAVLALISILIAGHAYYQRTQVTARPAETILPTPSTVKLSSLEHVTAGYRLQYPQGWQAVLINNAIEITNLPDSSKITISLKDRIPEFTIESASSTPEEIAKLNHIAVLIRNTVELIEPQTLDKTEIAKRFVQ